MSDSERVRVSQRTEEGDIFIQCVFVGLLVATLDFSQVEV